ncbi:hypothetical protein ACF3N0_05390 [Moraxella atlantae]|uniref:hypothetical protein n=1 Tax=Faucicola atlantae TaxID=34059 RepID=UPI0025B11F19|nr:hypothetical protein [Moraxella atlantae]
MKKYNMQSSIDQICVEFAYMMLLNREVESNEVLLEQSKQEKTISELIDGTKDSAEYRLKNDEFNRAINLYIKVQSQNNTEISGISDEVNNCITVIQSSDSNKYREILNISKSFNIRYVKQYKLNYHYFFGIKKGKYAHHAMYNRIYMLDEMIKNNYRGWVFYLDADSIIVNKNFDLREKLLDLRSNHKIMWLHNVHQKNEVNYSWWNVNSGAFAIDLSSSIARNLVKTWRGIYDNFYSELDFADATQWNDIINDQDSLWRVLDIFNLENKVELEQLQKNFVQQALRSQHDGISSEEEMQDRMHKLKELGERIYNS